MGFAETIIYAFLHLLALIGAITLHEAAHGMVAYWFKDPTAKEMNRLTLNPLAHLDMVGTIILPGLLFLSHAPYVLGWAKPVPINFQRLSPLRMGIICVALAGPCMNLVLAWGSGVLLHINADAHTFGNDLLIQFMKTNIILAIFNLLPLPPLDGGRVLTAALPASMAISFSKIEAYAPLILMGFMISPLLFHLLGVAFDPVSFVLLPPYKTALYAILGLSGHL